MELDPFAVVEALTIAGLRDAVRSRATSTSAASTRCADARLAARDRAGARGRAARRRRDGRAASPSTSSCGAARAPTSAARRPRCSSRSRATAASRATSRRSRSRSGLFGKPTAINNVETLLNVLDIVARSAAPRTPRPARDDSTGTRLFCLSGHVERPGLYEVPFGTTLRELLDLAGGSPADGRCRRCCSAARPARSSGPTRSTLPLTFEATRAIGAYARVGRRRSSSTTAVDLADVVLRIARVLPRRVVRPVRPVPASARSARRRRSHRLRPRAARTARSPTSGRLLDDIAQVMRDASICGLGQTAANADPVGHLERSASSSRGAAS